MVEIWDSAELSKDQRVEFCDDGIVWIIQAGDKPREIKLDAGAARRLLDALRQYEADLTLAAKNVFAHINKRDPLCA